MNKLKKIMCILLILTIIFAGGAYVSNASQVKSYDEDLKSIENKVIRFHVLANSDSVEDQALKLKVRDKVLEYISPKLKESTSIESSRKILKENDENIIKICENVIKNSGYFYAVKTTLSKENFPVKSYGNITFPQGNYEAYRILIGTGDGKNWWCVMFPPLCFVDITKGEVSYDETKAEMQKVLSRDEYDMVENTKPKEKIQVKFKLLEIINSVKEQIQKDLSNEKYGMVKNTKPKEKVQVKSNANKTIPSKQKHESNIIINENSVRSIPKIHRNRVESEMF